MTSLISEISGCRLCTERFRATATGHDPSPLTWFDPHARLLIASQAPGMRAHRSGRPFADPSGVRLRDWMDVTPDIFYDRSRIAIVPMGFCFPGYSASGSDLPPPRICAQTWRDRVLRTLPDIRLTLVVGGYAAKYHLGSAASVTEEVRAWKTRGDDIFVLPHPSWRNTAWLKKNPWFEADVLPLLRARIKDVLHD